MRIIFFGSSDFAVPVLEGINGTEEVILTVTAPDRKKGRSLKVASTPVKLASKRLGIKTFQPETVNDADSIKYLKGFKADIFVVVSFGQILHKELLDIPGLYALNVHASVLPRYRGAAPINWAVANGEKTTGVTIIRMNEKMDEGEILLKESVSIDSDEDAVGLSKRLSKIARSLLLRSVDLIKADTARFSKQDNTKATHAPKLKKQDGLIDWSWSADKICNRIRAFVPWPGCYTYWKDKMLKIWRAGPEGQFPSKPSKPGTVLKCSSEGILVSTGDGVLRIEGLQLEGKRRMKAEEFIIGHREMTAGAVFLLHR